MGNFIGTRVPDRSAQAYGGNPFPVASEAGQDGKGGSAPLAQVAHQEQQQQQELRGNWRDDDSDSPLGKLSCGEKVVAVILGLIACLIFIYPPMALIVGGSQCPEEFFLLPYFGFVTGAGALATIGGVSSAGARGIFIGLFPMIFFSLPAIFMYATGFGDGCVFLGVENGLFLFYPVLTGSFLLILCTAGRTLSANLRSTPQGRNMFTLNSPEPTGAWANTQLGQNNAQTTGWN